MRDLGLERQIARQPVSSSPWPDESRVAFPELAMPLFGSLYNFAHWLTRNREDAEDLVQKTYVKARGFDAFQRGTNFRAWIFQILRNTCATSRSKRVPRKVVPLNSEEDLANVPSSSDSAELLLVRYSDLQSIRCAIEELPPIFQKVRLLCDVEEMLYQEIAHALSIPIGTVISRLARGRRAVRVALGKTSARFRVVQLERREWEALGNKDSQFRFTSTRALSNRTFADDIRPGLPGSMKEDKVTSGIRFAAGVLILTAACFAQEGLTVRAKGKQNGASRGGTETLPFGVRSGSKRVQCEPLGGTIGHVSSRRRQERGRVRPTGNQA
jgi:RNA polymerase sigma factor (sigma-70 family)